MDIGGVGDDSGGQRGMEKLKTQTMPGIGIYYICMRIMNPEPFATTHKVG